MAPLRPRSRTPTLCSWAQGWVSGGEWVLPAGQSLMGCHQEFGLYPAAVGRLSAEKGVGLRKDPCGGGFKNGRPSWSPGHLMMTGDLGGGLGGIWWLIAEGGWVGERKIKMSSDLPVGTLRGQWGAEGRRNKAEPLWPC